MNLFFLKHEKKVYLDLKEALLIRREENVLILRRLCTDFQKRRKCTKFEKLMYIFVIKKKNLRRREEFKKKMYIPKNTPRLEAVPSLGEFGWKITFHFKLKYMH